MKLAKKIDGTYSNIKEQAVFENSIDCLTYGYGFKFVNTCGLEDSRAKQIFKKAKSFLARN